MNPGKLAVLDPSEQRLVFQQKLEALLSENQPSLNAVETKSPLQETFTKLLAEKLELVRQSKPIGDVDTQNLQMTFGFMEVHQKMYQETLKQELEIKALYQDKNDERVRKIAALWAESKEKEAALKKAMMSLNAEMQKLELEKEEQAHRHHLEELKMLEEIRRKQEEAFRANPPSGASVRFQPKPLLHQAIEMGKEHLVQFYASAAPQVEVDSKGNTPFGHALLQGKLNLAFLCKTKKKEGLEFKNAKGATYLHLAILSGNLEAVAWVCQWARELLEVPDKKGRTPLALAVLKGHLPCVKYLIADKMANRFVRDNQYRTLLHLAALRDRVEVLGYLISSDLVELLESQDKLGLTPLQIAVSQGHLQTAVKLVEHKSVLGAVDRQGRTLMHLAAIRGNLPLIHRLHGLGCPLDSVDQDAKTPLHLAVEKGMGEAARCLRKLGASFGESDSLHHCGSPDLIEFLIANKFSLSKENEEGLTPLEIFIRRGRIDLADQVIYRPGMEELVPKKILSLLLQAIRSKMKEAIDWVFNLNKPLPVKDKDGSGNTPLKVALESNFPYAITRLLDQGVLTNTYLAEGLTYLHVGARVCDPESFEILLRRYEHLEVPDQRGSTPLHTALRADRLENAKMLVSKGAKPDSTKNDRKQTLLHLIAQTGNVLAYEWLMEISPSFPVDEQDSSMYPPLAYALKGGHLALAQKLLVRKAKVTGVMGGGNTALHFTCMSGSLELLNLIVQAVSLDPNAKNEEGETPLTICIKHGFLPLALSLKNHYESKLSFPEGIFVHAFRSPQAGIDCLEWLINNNNRDFREVDEHGFSVLYYMILCGPSSKVNYLFNKFMQTPQQLRLDEFIMTLFKDRNIFEFDYDFLRYLIEQKNVESAVWVNNLYAKNWPSIRSGDKISINCRACITYAEEKGLANLTEILIKYTTSQPKSKITMSVPARRHHDYPEAGVQNGAVTPSAREAGVQIPSRPLPPTRVAALPPQKKEFRARRKSPSSKDKKRDL